MRLLQQEVRGYPTTNGFCSLLECRRIRVRSPLNVPRYYFHFSDGKRQFSDGAGHELPGLAAARAQATAQVRELKAALCASAIQDLSGYSMTVTDTRGRTVFVLGFDLRPRAGLAMERAGI